MQFGDEPEPTEDTDAGAADQPGSAHSPAPSHSPDPAHSSAAVVAPGPDMPPAPAQPSLPCTPLQDPAAAVADAGVHVPLDAASTGPSLQSMALPAMGLPAATLPPSSPAEASQFASLAAPSALEDAAETDVDGGPRRRLFGTPQLQLSEERCMQSVVHVLMLSSGLLKRQSHLSRGLALRYARLCIRHAAATTLLARC